MEEALKERFRQLIKGEYEFDCEESEQKMLDILQSAYNMALPQWVRVSEKMPPVCESILAYGAKSGVNIRYFSKGYETLNNQEFEKLSSVTHWMPLPPNPKD